MKANQGSLYDGFIPFKYPNHFQSSFTINKVVICQDDYELRIAIIRPRPAILTEPLPVFFYIPSCIENDQQKAKHVRDASKFVIASGQAAIIVLSNTGTEPMSQVFELFAAMKWVAAHGRDQYLDGANISILGLRLGLILQPYYH